MTFAKKYNPVGFPYSIGDAVLKKSSKFRDLRVTFDSRLSDPQYC